MRPLSLAHLTMLDATPLQLIDAAVAGRFDSIGLRIVPPTPADALSASVVGDRDMIRSIARAMDDTGVRILDVETFWLSPQFSIDDVRPALETAAKLGVRYLLTVGNDPDEGRVVASFARFCEAARPLGLKAMLEFIPFCQTRTVADALRVVRSADQPNAGILIDALHVVRSGASANDLRNLDPAMLDYWQLCDAALERPADGDLRTEARARRFYPGEGQLPLASMLAAMPPDSAISVEAPCQQYAELPWEQRGRRCGEATRRILGAEPRA